MTDKLDLILEKLSLLESSVSENIEITKALRDRQDETDAKLDALSMDVNKLHGVVTSHTELINTLVKSQERQEKILETLALRSLEQETDIRELKRIK